LVSFGVWPMPEGTKLEDAPLPAPRDEPEAKLGDLAHGKALCAARCRTDIEGALPKDAAPTFLRSDFAAGLSDDELLKAVLKPEASQLTPLERNNILFYLHGLHLRITDFFPDADAVIAQTFTINEHGKKRLLETLNLTLSDAEAVAKVFVAYKAGDKAATGPALVEYGDRVSRDRLKRRNKLGYLVFVEIPKEPKAKELAIALSREPVYAISDMRARDSQGQLDPALNKQLKTFVGEGKFNDAKSLKKGAAALQSKILPIYLRTAELATMFYAAEREFTEFDAEFDGGDDVSAEGGDFKFKNKK
jgi:hypothetical protein